MNNSRDIAIAVLGGAVSLSGLLLIFSGFLFSQSASFDQATVDDVTINKYRSAAKFGVFPFALCLGVAGTALFSLQYPMTWLIAVTFWGFVALLAVTAAYGGYVILKYL